MTTPAEDGDAGQVSEWEGIRVVQPADLPRGSRAWRKALLAQLVGVFSFRVRNNDIVTFAECKRCRALMRANPGVAEEHMESLHRDGR